MNKCGFIVEFDETTQKQINALWMCLLENNIKFNVLKANDDYLKEQEFIEYLEHYISLLKDRPDELEESQIAILEEVLEKYKEIVKR